MELSKTEFVGDVFLNGRSGIGDIDIENGLVQDCRDFSTAVYLSLFGGNKGDYTGRDNETWWGNLIPGTQKNEKLVSSFYAVVNGFPLNSASIKKAAKAAEYDLKWLTDEGIADEVDISIYAVSIKKVQLDVRIIKSGKDIFKNAYAFQWQGEIDGIRK